MDSNTLTGQQINAEDAIAVGLADVKHPSALLPSLWLDLANRGLDALGDLQVATLQDPPPDSPVGAKGASMVAARAQIDHFFSLPSVLAIVQELENDPSAWATRAAADLRKRSPLMLHVALEQVRRGRQLSLADDLRMERGMMRQCFHWRPAAASETVEGIRALAVDKDQQPRWNPPRIEDVTPALVAVFFESPWPAHAHPLKCL